MRLAYLVDGRMASGQTGSGHHIRNFFGRLGGAELVAGCFDTISGARLDPLGTPVPVDPPLGARLRGLARRYLADLEPASLRMSRRRIRARAYLGRVHGFPDSAFRALESFAPDFLLCRLSHANTYVLEASRRMGVPYGLECNAPIRRQEGAFGTLVDPEDCEHRESAVVGGAEFVTYVSDATRDLCFEIPSYRSVPGYVVRNCADAAFFALPRVGSERDLVRESLEVGPDDTLAIYVGSFKRWHRAEWLVEAAQMIDEPGIKIVLAGWGGNATVLQRRIRRARRGAPVQMLGMVPHGDLPTIVAAADVGVQPGANDYSAPLKLIEYMAAGLAVIAPRVPPIEEVATNRTNACLLEDTSPQALAEALVSMHRERRLRTSLGARARKDVGHMTWAANASQVVGIIVRHQSGASTDAPAANPPEPRP